MRSDLAALIVASAAVGCVRGYAAEPALSYQAVRYESVDGKAWPEKSLVLRRGVRVTYVELNPEGARTVVFVHGLGSYLKFWRYQLDLFAARGYRVIALDMVGYGKSDKPASFPYTMEAMADVVREVVERTGTTEPVLVGHSMGGQIALSYAIRWPDEPAALVLSAPAGFEEFSDKEKRWLEKVFTVNLVAGATEYEIWGNVAYNNFYRWRPELEWLVEERVRITRDPTFKSYAYAQVKSVHGLAANDFVRTNLGKVEAPTIIVHGSEDRLIPNPFMHGGSTRAVMEHGHAGIKGSSLVTLDDCGHSVQIDCPAEYNEAVLEFLQRLPAPAPRAPKSEPQHVRPAPKPVPEPPPAAAPAPEPEGRLRRR